MRVYPVKRAPQFVNAYALVNHFDAGMLPNMRVACLNPQPKGNILLIDQGLIDQQGAYTLLVARPGSIVRETM